MEENIETTESVEEVSSELVISVPKLVPDEITINGVKSSDAILDKLKEEVKAMEIKGLTDDEGFNAAVKKLDEVKKAAREEERWRKSFFDPFLKFKKALDTRITKTNVAKYDEMQEHLEKIIKPIQDFKELEKERLLKEQEAKAEERAKLLISVGLVFNGAGTYDFSLDQSEFILHSTLKDWNDEQFNMEYERFKAIWDTEQERLKAEEEARLGAEAKLQSQVADLNAERTEMRRELLEMRGYVLTDGFYNNGTHQSISEDAVINTPTKAEWDALFVLIPKEMETVEEQQTIAPEPLNEVEMPDVNDMSFEVPEIVEDVPLINHTPIPEISHEENPLHISGVPEFTKDETTYDCHLVFTNDEPYIEVPIGMMKIRLYHSELEGVSLEGVEKDNIALTGEIKGELKFTVMK